MTEASDAAKPEEATASSGSDTVPAYSWYALGVLVLIYVLNFIDRQILSILANDIKADLGVEDDYLGFLYGTAFAVFYALFGIPLGKLADSWKRVRLMSLGLALWSTMTALSGFAKNATTLTVARIGVGVGEATASPSAYSLISDWFPARLRATALAIYSSGLYIGGGISLLIGGLIVENWNAAYPDGGPLGLVGWQAAFLSVGLPGLVLALWVLTLREPVRGAIDGLPTPEDPAPFRGFVQELFQVIPPFTVFGAASRGAGALVVNLLGAAFFAGLAWALWRWTGVFEQWLFLGVGYYAVFSWAMGLRARDLPTFKLTWGSPAFLCVVLGYGTVAFTAYAASYWGAPYAERALGVDKTDLGWFLGAPAAVAGFLGVIIGGRLADFLLERRPEGRVWVILFGLVTPLPAMWLAYTTDDVVLFYIGAFLAQMLSAAALGAAAASSQALVLPRMRGLATATFFLSTTLIGLGLGPFMAGYVSATNGDDLSFGVLSTLIAAPFGFVLLIAALRLVPQAAASVVERARAAGEPV
ncbi:MAG: MFS transporter [Pseudomonadota bacterium]|uniref:MFS transporter n=1 Tax=Qipengyuania flava TaxID=192812 RepID=UPI000C48EB98|nr:MFS transporter [Qipengyuania flava]MAH16842.1 MFS transporter [Sphingomonadaceae bacterium]MCA0888817.1 MFS transporter [Qipengyuania flava]MEC7622660.1 MFS transporter [Pseudomonadota bacterium]